MTFVCDDTFNSFIKNYQIKDDIIIVNYFNKPCEKFPFSIEKEKNLKKLMLEQAKRRRDSISTINFYKEKGNLYTWGEIKAILMTIIYFLYNINENFSYEINRDNFILVGSFYSIVLFLIASIGSTTFEILKSKPDMEEIDKYNLYLDIYEELNRVSPEVEEYVNINTLDNCSITEIKKLAKKAGIKYSKDY